MKKNRKKPGNIMRILAVICALVLCIQAVPISISMSIIANAAEKTDEEVKVEKEKSSSTSSDEKKSEKSEEEKEKEEEKASDQKDEEKKDSSSDVEKSQDAGNSKSEEKKDQEDKEKDEKESLKTEDAGNSKTEEKKDQGDKEKDEKESSKTEDAGKDVTSSKSGEEQNSDSGKTDEKQDKGTEDKKEENSDNQKSGENGSGPDASEKKENDNPSSGKSDSGASGEKSVDSKEDSSSDGTKGSGTGKTDSPEKKDDTKDDSTKKKAEAEKDDKAVTDDQKVESESASEVKKNEGTNTQNNVAVAIYKGDDEVKSKIKVESEEKFTAKVSGADEYENISYQWTKEGSFADSVELEEDKENKVTVSPVSGKKGGEVTLKVVVKSGDTTLAEKTATLDVYTAYAIDEVQIKDGKDKEITDQKADVSDTLTASLKFKSDASNDDRDEGKYSFRWQKKDSEGNFKDIEGSSASSKSYQVTEEGTYRVSVTRAADSDHNRLAYEGKSSSVKASKIPVSIEWENKSRAYDGTNVFSYTGKGTVTRTDDDTADSWEISPGTAQEITLNGSDAGDYEDVDIPIAGSLDTDIYAVSSSKAKKLTIDPYPIKANVTVWGKNFDNTTEVKASTDGSVLSVEWKDLDAALDAAEIKDSLQLLLGGSALAYTDLEYSGAGDVDSDTSVQVALKNENASKKYTVSGDTGEGKPNYSNYTVKDVTFANATIKAVTFNDGSAVATAASGVVRGDTIWVGENAELDLAAKDGFQIGNDYQNDSDFSGSITVDVHEKSGDGTGYDGVVFYVKNTAGEIGKAAWSSIKIDKTAPTVNMVDVKKISNADYTNNKYSVSDTESGISAVKVLISETDQTNATPDGSWTTISLPDDKTARDTNEFTFEIKVPSYGFVYIYAEDQTANKSVTESHVAIYENKSPDLTITCSDASNPTKGKSSIKIAAKEKTDQESGIKSVALSLREGINVDNGNEVGNVFTVDDSKLPEGVAYGNKQFTRSSSDPENLTQAQAYKTLEAQFSISEDKKLDGDYTLYVTALDYCGNSTTQTAVLKFDNTAPTYEVFLDGAGGSAVDGTYYYNAASGEGLTVTLSDTNLAAGGSYSAVLRDAKNTEIKKENLIKSDAGDGTKGTISFSATEIQTLSDGLIMLEVSATDYAGNACTSGAKTIEPGELKQTDDSMSFVLDTTAPVLSSSKTTIPEDGSIPILENSTFYYSGTFTTVATITDLNIDKKYVTASFSELDDTASGSVQISDDGKSITFSGTDNAVFGYLKVTGKDYAGNPLKISDSFEAGTSDGQDAWEVKSQESNILGTTNNREIESRVPVASVTYKKLDAKRIVGKKAYYKDSISAELVLSDIAKDDYKRVSMSVKKDGESVEGFTNLTNWDEDGKISVAFEGKSVHSSDGNYQISIKGTNRAGTPISVKESSPDEKPAETPVPTDGNDYTMEYTLVLDTTNPIAEIEITPESSTANPSLNEEYGSRYYFNKNHTAKVTVTEKNLNISNADKGIVKVSFAQETPATKDEEGNDKNDGYTDASTVSFALEKFATVINGNATDTGAVFEYATLTDGVRQYLVEGEDLAGNPVVYEDSANNIDTGFSGTTEGVFASYPVVTDTIVPLMWLTVTATQDGTESIAYKMDSTGAVLASNPYQKAADASIVAQLADVDAERTPYRFYFHEEDTNGIKNNKENEKFALKTEDGKKQNLSLEVSSPLVFWLKDFYVEDLAGNKSTTGFRTNDIYLDTHEPGITIPDNKAPTIVLYPKERPGKYGIEGRPLFKDDVPFAIGVVDPYGPTEEGGVSRGSTGLKKVKYSLKYKNNAGEFVELTNEDNQDIFTYDEAPLNNSNFVYAINETVTIKKKNNYNSLTLTVTATDNVGNESTAEYTFGIDCTAPVITLFYDNNDVKNDYYFKDKRTATIKVTERNFDASLFTVGVEGHANGSEAEGAGTFIESTWSCEPGKPDDGELDNGDKDVWTKTIAFENEGDYNVSFSVGDYEFLSGNQDSGKTYAVVDRAGNPAELTVENGTKAWDAFVIDKTAPNVSISMGGSYLDGPYEDGNYYYNADNCAITASFDDNGHEFGMEGGQYKVTIDGRTDAAFKELALVKMVPASGTTKYKKAQVLEYTAQELAQGDSRLLKDGEHVITVTAVDAAGNEATATDFKIASTGCKFGDLNGTFILDTTNPVAKVDIKPESGTAKTALNREYGNRYYFNKNHTATVTVTEKNLKISNTKGYKDKGTIKVSFAQEVPATKDKDGKDKNDGYTDASAVTFKSDKFNTVVDGNTISTGAVFKYETPVDGVRQYLVEGEDLAGNPVVYEDSANNIDTSFSGTTEGVFASYPVVTDTIVPLMWLTVTATQDGTESIAYKKDSTGAVLASNPYQKAADASIVAQLADVDAERTPYRFYFHEEDTNGIKNNKENEKFALKTEDGKKQNLSLEVSSPLVFWVEDFYVEDLAGNRSAYDLNTQYIYLDTHKPEISIADHEAPTIVLYPKERSGYKYGIDGRPLFNDNVPFAIGVEDPFGPTKEGGASHGSTGLKKVKYSLKYKNNAGEFVELTNEDNQDIFTYDEAPLNNSNFVYKFDKTVIIKKQNNYNSLTLTVTATDNVGNTAKATYTFGIDATNPVITLSYDNNNAKNEKYFKKRRKATLKVTERNFDANLFSVKVTGKANGSEAENAGIFEESAWSCKKGKSDNGDDDVWTKTIAFNNDGDYTLAVVAKKYAYLKEGEYSDYAVIDRAGNPAKVTVVEKTQAAYKFTIDTIAPTFTLDISSKNSTNKNLNEQGNRYYFNKEYTATVTVSDVNYDAPSITVLRGTFKSDGKYNSEKRIVSDFNERITSKNTIFKDKIGNEKDSDGVYRYVIFGCDKAGNALVPSSMENLDGTVVELGSQKISEIESEGSLEKTANKSVHIVVDKTAPKGSIVIKEEKKDKTESIYETDIDGNVTFASPYRQGTVASIKFSVYVSNRQENQSKEFEHSPVKIDYQVDSTIDDGKKVFTGKEYAYNNSKTRTQKGKQIFNVTKYTLTDLAGNERSYGPFNNVHLDVVKPTVDELGPITKIVASAEKGTSGYTNGQNLFSSDVKLKIKVTDPEAGNSSGLGKITYQMFIGDKLVDGDTVTLHEDNTKKYDGNYKDNNNKYNSQIERECTKEISVSSKSHNYNNLRAVVTAFDNAGNSSTKEYKFGIDITAPTVDVSYDNNNAQNGEYFNKNRTATVVVKDRNFDKDKFKIKTENNASISGWTHKSNGGNGDSDTWTAKVTYSNDGNYTLEVSGTDRVNNKAVKINYNGTAPRKFTIDKTAPTVTVTYDNNNAANTKYYKDPRKATISVNDVNFGGQHAITVNASGGGSAPSVGFSGNTAVLTFDKDGIYVFNGTVTDKAGNTTTIPTQTEFVIDRTPPAVTVKYENTDVRNGYYFKAAQTAVITVNDVNFNGQNDIRIKTRGGGIAPSTVSFSGKTATQKFSEDGIYVFNGTVTDMAGNVTTLPEQKEFVIDCTKPVLRFDNNKPFAITPAVNEKSNDEPVNNQFFEGDTFAPRVTVRDTNCSTNPSDAIMQIIGTKNFNHFDGVIGSIASNANEFDIYIEPSKFDVVSERDDVYTVTAYAIDKAGNKSDEVTFTFSLNRFGSNYVADEESGTRSYIRDRYYHNDTDHDLLIREYNPNTIKKDTQKIEMIKDGNTATRKKLVLGTDYEFAEDPQSKLGGRIYLYTIKKSVFEEEGDYSFTISSEDEAGHKNSTARVHYDKDENGKSTNTEVHSFPIDFVVDKTAPSNQLVGVSSNSKQTFNQDSLTMEIHPDDTQTAVSEVEVRRWKTSADFFGNPTIPDKEASPEEITVYRYYGEEEIPADQGNIKYAELSEYMNPDTDKISIPYSIRGGSDWQVVEVITTDLAGNKSTDIREGGMDEKGVKLDESRRSYLITTNPLTRLLNNPAVRFAFAAVVILILALIFIRKSRKEKA